ncbi:hypothetical protein FSP39_014151 [Pinctada imbricata]|uniref:BTB domain-containing protein n=1 Tax=Pinctada imbricata TaxID=66713 RepID=A0AA88YAX6_PINIB|nr:hypothetical protein FSP39_014151 [Pinctada imbricata]
MESDSADTSISNEDQSGCHGNDEASETIAICIKNLCHSEDMTDVSFVFPNDGNRRVRAHKLVLSVRSPVFKAMFYGGLPENPENISIPDISANVFTEFIRYIYTDKAELDDRTVTELLYASNKYQFAAMMQKCEEYLLNALSVDNACTVFSQASVFDMTKLKAEVMSYINIHALEVFKSPDFQNLTKDCLADILSSEDITASEFDIIEAILQWAEQKCKSRDLEPTGMNMREVLGDLLYKLRILSLSLQQFSEIVAVSGILRDDEELCFYRYFSRGVKSETTSKFSAIERRRLPPLSVELGSIFSKGNRVGHMVARETFNFKVRKPFRLLQMEFMELPDVSPNFSYIQLTNCEEDNHVAHIKILETYMVEGSTHSETILETVRSNKIGKIRLNIEFNRKKENHRLTVNVRKHCHVCGVQTALNYQETGQTSNYNQFTGSSNKSYPTKSIADGIDLQIKEQHIVRLITLVKIPEEDA